MSELDNLFGGDAPEAEVVQPEPAAPEAVATEPAGTPPVADAVPEPAPAPVVQQDQPMQPPPGFVPVAEVQRLRAELRELRSPPQVQQQPDVDVFADPDGFRAQMSREMAQISYQNRLGLSQEWNRERLGEQKFGEVMQWAFDRCAADPIFNQQVYSAPDPIGFAAKEFQRHRTLQAIGNTDLTEIEQFRAWKTAQAQVQTQTQTAPAPAAQPQSAAIPTPSLASATSAAGSSSAPKPDPVGDKLARMF